MWLQTGDARLVPPKMKPVAAIFSCFGLQQMPAPAEVYAGWLKSLTPGGLLAGMACALKPGSDLEHLALHPVSSSSCMAQLLQSASGRQPNRRMPSTASSAASLRM